MYTDIQWSVILAGLKSKMSSAQPTVEQQAAGSKTWFVYILRCADDTLYTGVSTHVERRLDEHNAGAPLGARYTRARRPVVLVYQESASGRAAAQRREREIKSKSRAWKTALIAAGDAPAQ
jgi:putative endonuclease